MDDFYRYKKELIDMIPISLEFMRHRIYHYNKVIVQDISSPRFSPRQVKIANANYTLFKRIKTQQNEKRIKKSMLNRLLIQEFIKIKEKTID